MPQVATGAPQQAFRSPAYALPIVAGVVAAGAVLIMVALAAGYFVFRALKSGAPGLAAGEGAKVVADREPGGPAPNAANDDPRPAPGSNGKPAAAPKPDAPAPDTDVDALLFALSGRYWHDNNTSPVIPDVKDPDRLYATLSLSKNASLAAAARQATEAQKMRGAIVKLRESQADADLLGFVGRSMLANLAKYQEAVENKEIDKDEDPVLFTLEDFEELGKRLSHVLAIQDTCKRLAEGAEAADARAVARALRPALAARAGKESAVPLECWVGCLGENAWLTVRNTGPAELSRLTFALELRSKHSIRYAAFYLPRLAAASTFRAKVSIMPVVIDPRLGGQSRPDELDDFGRMLTARYTCWADQGRAEDRDLPLVSGREAWKHFLLVSLTPGVTYWSRLSDRDMSDDKEFALKLTGLKAGPDGHRVTATLTTRHLSRGEADAKETPVEALIKPQDFGPLKGPSGGPAFALQFRGEKAAFRCSFDYGANWWWADGSPVGGRVFSVDRSMHGIKKEQWDEWKAEKMHTEALDLILRNRRPEARKLLEQIVREFPGTKAAQAAAFTLKRPDLR
jgi:hypothetical protein